MTRLLLTPELTRALSAYNARPTSERAQSLILAAWTDAGLPPAIHVRVVDVIEQEQSVANLIAEAAALADALAETT